MDAGYAVHQPLRAAQVTARVAVLGPAGAGSRQGIGEGVGLGVWWEDLWKLAVGQ